MLMEIKLLNKISKKIKVHKNFICKEDSFDDILEILICQLLKK